MTGTDINRQRQTYGMRKLFYQQLGHLLTPFNEICLLLAAWVGHIHRLLHELIRIVVSQRLSVGFLVSADHQEDGTPDCQRCRPLLRSQDMEVESFYIPCGCMVFKKKICPCRISSTTFTKCRR